MAGRRRTPADIEEIKVALAEIAREAAPASVRQIFYLAVTRGIVEKTQAEYQTTVARLLAGMRKEGRIPFSWITDSTRRMRKPVSYPNIAAGLKAFQDRYRRDIWKDQEDYVELWCESDSVAGVLEDVCIEWDVPLQSARGYSSITFLHDAAETIIDKDRPTFLYYFGDHDPSGLDISRNIEEGLREMGAEFMLVRAAVTPEQIEDLELETMPPKKSDTRSKGFDGGTVEIEAIPPDQIRELARGCVERHVDHDQLQRTQRTEKRERGKLRKLLH